MPKKLTQEEYERKVKLINPNIAVIGTYINNETKILHKCLRDGVVIKGAITLGLITEERALYQLSNVKNIKQTLQFAC